MGKPVTASCINVWNLLSNECFFRIRTLVFGGAFKKLKAKKMTIYLDTEATGLSPPRDEILEIVILDDKGRMLSDSLVRPENHRIWPGAQANHGISPSDAVNAPTLDEPRSGIIDAVSGKEVVIHNAVFDSRFLPAELE